MGKAKVAITLEEELLARLDDLVAEKRFASRSGAVEVAVAEKLSRLDRSRLARECAKLDPDFEQQLADEGISGDLAEWPEYWEEMCAGQTSAQFEAMNKLAGDLSW